MAKKEENSLENALNIDPIEDRKTTPNVEDSDTAAEPETGMRKKVELDLSKFPERKKIEQRKDFGEVRENIKEDEQVRNVTNNAFFVGSTKELQDLVRQQLPEKKVKKVKNNDKETG